MAVSGLVKILYNLPLHSAEQYKNKCQSEKNNDVISLGFLFVCFLLMLGKAKVKNKHL